MPLFIFDAFKNAFLPQDKEQIFKEDLELHAGLKYKLENPDTLISDKNTDLTLYDKMLSDDKIKSTIELKKRLTLSIPYDIQPASNDPKDTEISTVISQMLENMDVKFSNVMDNMLDSMIYGFKVGELVFDIIDGKVTLKNIKVKHSIFYDFDYDEYGNFTKLFVGYRYGKRIEIEGDDIKRKFVIFTYPYAKDGNMYGDSDLKSIYPQWYAKDHIFKWRNIRLQNWGSPIPVVKYDTNKTSQAELDDLVDMLDHLQDNMYVVVPSTRGVDGQLNGKFDIQLLETTGNASTTEYQDAIDQIDKQIARGLLIADKIGFSESDGGSYALGETQTDTLFKIIEDLHGRLEDVFNPIVKMLVDYNFDVEEYPVLKFAKMTDKIKAETLAILIDKGVVDKTETWIRKYVGIPELTEEEQDEIDERKNGEKEVELDIAQPDVEEELASEDEKKKDGVSPFKNDDPIKDLQKVQDIYDRAEADFVRQYDAIHKDNSEYLISQVNKKELATNIKQLDALKIKKTELKDLLSIYYTKLYLEGKVYALDTISKRTDLSKMKIDKYQIDEDEYEFLDKSFIDKYLKKYGATINKTDKAALKKLRDTAYLYVGDIESRMTKIVKDTVVNGTRNGLTLETITSQVRDLLTEDRKKYAETTARTTQSSAFNDAATNMYNGETVKPLIEAYMYSAVLDEATTDFCREHDGHVIYASDPELQRITPPNHFNCRSVLVPIFVEDNESKDNYFYDYKSKLKEFQDGVPFNAQQPSKNFGG